jgi:cell division protein FtsW (lipid II flippase)
MLLLVIAWILFMAKAPWWIWVCFVTHIVGCFFAWLFDTNKSVNKLIDKLKEL